MAEDMAALSDFEDDDEPAVLVSSPEVHQSAEDRLRKELEEVRREADRSKSELKKLLKESSQSREMAVKERDDALKQVEVLSKQKDDAVKSRSEIESSARLLVTGAERITNLVGDSKLFSGGLQRSTKYTGLAAISHGFCQRVEELVEVVVNQRNAAIKTRDEMVKLRDEMANQRDAALKSKDEMANQRDAALKTRDEMVNQRDAALKNRDQLREQMEQRNYQIAIEVSQLEAAVARSKEELENKDAEVRKMGEKMRVLQEKLTKVITELRARLETSEVNAGGLQKDYERVKEMVVAHFKGYLATEESFVNFLHKVDGKAVTPVGALPFSNFVDLDKVHEEYLRRVNSISDTLVHMENSWADKEEVRHKEKLELESSMKAMLEKEADAAAVLKGALGITEAADILTLASAVDAGVRSSRLKVLELESQLEQARMEIEKLKDLSLLQTKDIAEKAAVIHELEEKHGVTTSNVQGLEAEIAAASEELARWKDAAREEAAAGVAILKEADNAHKEVASLKKLVSQVKQSLDEANNKLQSKEEMAGAAMAARDAAERSLKIADERAAVLRERLEEMSQQLEDAEAQIVSSRMCGGKFLELFPWLRERLVTHRASLREARNQASSEMEELQEPLL